MNYEGHSLVDLVNTGGGGSNEKNAQSIINNQECFAEIYSQPMNEGLLTQRQWDPLAPGNHVLWVNGNGTAPIIPLEGTIRAMGIACKPSILSLVTTTGSGGGYTGIEWQYDPLKLVSVEMDTHTGVFATQPITQCQTWCRLMYYDSAGILIGEKSSFKQNIVNGTSTVDHINHSRFELDFTYVPGLTKTVRILPYINVSSTGTIQTTMVCNSLSPNENRLRVTVRNLY